MIIENDMMIMIMDIIEKAIMMVMLIMRSAIRNCNDNQVNNQIDYII